MLALNQCLTLANASPQPVIVLPGGPGPAGAKRGHGRDGRQGLSWPYAGPTLAAMIRTGTRDRPGPDLTHIEAWVFDLDNTLYPASCNLFAEIDRRMGEFISATLSVDGGEARRIQKTYFREYGTTLRGLMTNHGIDPDAFLEYVHQIDMSRLSPSPALAAALAQLQGLKIVFTNGSADHAEKVMARLGVTQYFDGVFDIIAADYRSKPDPEAYEALVCRHGLAPASSAIFEDLPRNLAPAAAMGMTTVWVRNDTIWAEEGDAGGGEEGAEEGAAGRYIHHVTDDLAGWLEDVAAVRYGPQAAGAGPAAAARQR